MSRCWLAGPEGHPFHPLLVPLPIGAFVIVADLRHPHPDPGAGPAYLVDGAFWLIGSA
jgi:hypothetical protein